ncbi:hypothetical protein QN379_22905, partial [Glaciimonas sp. Gout2]|uniref:hypothetical protein n=1 Tax=unclassified Glaciimonas TaxID=2644401 RepID=UPI002B226524
MASHPTLRSVFAALTKRFVCQQQRDEIMWHFELFVNFFLNHFRNNLKPNQLTTTAQNTPLYNLVSASNFALRTACAVLSISRRFQQRPNYSNTSQHWQAI